MKNLNVRLKILTSFGIIILLILAFSAFVIISNITVSNNARTMRYDMQMQEHSTDLVDYFSQANASVNIINYSFDKSAFDSVLSNIDSCRQTLQSMNAYINEHPELAGLRVEVDSVSASIDRWSGNLQEVLQLSSELESIVALSQKNQLILTGQSAGIFDYQMQLSREEANQELEPSTRLRRVDRVEQGVDISDRLNAIGATFALMFQSLDISNINADMAFFEDTVQVLTDFHEGSALQYNIDTSAAMLEALAAYKSNIEDFLSCFAKRESLSLAGNSFSADALKAVRGLVSAVELSSTGIADDTISRTSTLLVVSVVVVIAGIAVATFLALYVSGIISKPLITLSTFMKKAGETGDITLRPSDLEVISVYASYKDEIGQAISGSAAFVQHVTQVASELEAVSNGDLTHNITMLSDADTMGRSLKQMVDNLGNMLSEIQASTNQVSTGSRQVAEGAQALAQGSTEQAAAIEQLSSSIAEIADKTIANAETAEKTSRLSANIKDNAEKGSRQMDAMIAAVGEINDASKSISRIIKTIDDIAFQTNILALNAAVEAARAGQHGKGFAVVAEEVRNLASKSAEAAKDTGDMIQNSMEKAELGSRIAGETAESLKEIVTGINESSRFVAEIARSSEEQSLGISQINTGIDQVAQVIQQNSATAEQSAAVSEEMSGQSDSLQHLISQFKIKAGDTMYKSLPSAGNHDYLS